MRRPLLKNKFPSLLLCNLMNDCWFLVTFPFWKCVCRLYNVHVVRFVFHSKIKFTHSLSRFGSNLQNSTVWITTFLSPAESLLKILSWQITKPICRYLLNAWSFRNIFPCVCFGSVYSLHAYHSQIERWKFEYFTIFLAQIQFAWFENPAKDSK